MRASRSTPEPAHAPVILCTRHQCRDRRLRTRHTIHDVPPPFVCTSACLPPVMFHVKQRGLSDSTWWMAAQLTSAITLRASPRSSAWYLTCIHLGLPLSPTNVFHVKHRGAGLYLYWVRAGLLRATARRHTDPRDEARRRAHASRHDRCHRPGHCWRLRMTMSKHPQCYRPFGYLGIT